MKILRIYIAVCIIALLSFFFYNIFIQKPYNKIYSVRKLVQQHTMKITSPAFQEGQELPKQFTCEGENYNPPLQFSDIPPETKSLALTLEDPDTPTGVTWYHWFVYNISPELKGIGEHANIEGATEGTVSSGNQAYDGPCPPDPKAHRYIFTLYALNKMFDFPKETDIPQFRNLIQGHVIEKATLIGIYTGPAKQNK